MRRRCQQLTRFSLRPLPVTARRGKLPLWPVMLGKLETGAARNDLARAEQPRPTQALGLTQEPVDTRSHWSPCSPRACQAPHIVPKLTPHRTLVPESSSPVLAKGAIWAPHLLQEPGESSPETKRHTRHFMFPSHIHHDKLFGATEGEKRMGQREK